MDFEQFAQAFQKNYDRVVNYMGTGDQQFLMSLACKYTIANKPFSGVVLNKVRETLVEEAKRSFPIRNESTLSYIVAAQLLNETNLQAAINRLMENETILKEVKFKNSPFRVVGALFLRENRFEHARRAKALYDEMHQRHRFLTSNEDIPYVVLLTSDNNSDATVRAETAKRYYNHLRQQHFTVGNHLQALTQIMTIYSADYNEILIKYIVQLREELIKRNIKVKKMHYPFIGILALAATNDSIIDEIVTLHNYLLELKAFKNAKPYALIVAIQKTIKDLMEVQDVVDMTPLSQLEFLIDIADWMMEFTIEIPGSLLDIGDFLN